MRHRSIWMHNEEGPSCSFMSMLSYVSVAHMLSCQFHGEKFYFLFLLSDTSSIDLWESLGPLIVWGQCANPISIWRCLDLGTSSLCPLRKELDENSLQRIVSFSQKFLLQLYRTATFSFSISQFFFLFFLIMFFSKKLFFFWTAKLTHNIGDSSNDGEANNDPLYGCHPHSSDITFF